MGAARTPSPFFKVAGDMLNGLIVKAVKKKSFSITGDMDVLELRGVTTEGESFPIDHVEVRLGRAARVNPSAAADMSGQHTRVPAGKLRLAAVDGVAR